MMEREREAERTKTRIKGGEEAIMKKRPAGRLAGSPAAKAAALILYIVSVTVGLLCILLCVYMAEKAFFTGDKGYALRMGLESRGMTAAYTVRSYIENGNLEGAGEYCENRNVDVELWLCDSENSDKVSFLWSSNGSSLSDANLNGLAYVELRDYMSFPNLSKRYVFGNHTLNREDFYLFRVYIDLSFPIDDDFKEEGERLLFLYEKRYLVIVCVAVCALICGSCFFFLMCAAGHKNGVEGIVPGLLTGLPFELLVLCFAGGIVLGRRLIDTLMYRDIFVPVTVTGGILLAMWLVIFFQDFAVRVKQGHVFRRTLIFMGIREIKKGLMWAAGSLPAAAVAIGAALFCSALETGAAVAIIKRSIFSDPLNPWVDYMVLGLIWGLDRILLLGAAAYAAVNFDKLLRASRRLAEGQDDCRVDTKGMLGDFKAYGESLNSLGEGIGRAVAERVKSERLKTELITNVSHDIKTPLTSIINYAGLISKEKSGNERIEEYSEVLLRQSTRLQKLLEDLMEASKAATGNVEVNLEPCEVGVLLIQAAGEYQKRMEERELELIVRHPEEPVMIMADGRHLWRVFDNLLNNICKYSQERSRVYLNVEAGDAGVSVIFRNMSKYALDTAPEELKERFVRGDKSRHMEGNGLGLSIAESLTRLQGGRMEIVTDGDLFKVILRFEILGDRPNISKK